jgi:hypothetical protein
LLDPRRARARSTLAATLVGSIPAGAFVVSEVGRTAWPPLGQNVLRTHRDAASRCRRSSRVVVRLEHRHRRSREPRDVTRGDAGGERPGDSRMSKRVRRHAFRGPAASLAHLNSRRRTLQASHGAPDGAGNRRRVSSRGGSSAAITTCPARGLPGVLHLLLRCRRRRTSEFFGNLEKAHVKMW